MQKKRVLYLDLIRIVCFLMVTSFHFAIGVRNFGISADSLRSKLAIRDGGTVRIYGYTDHRGEPMLAIVEPA